MHGPIRISLISLWRTQFSAPPPLAARYPKGACIVEGPHFVLHKGRWCPLYKFKRLILFTEINCVYCGDLLGGGGAVAQSEPLPPLSHGFCITQRRTSFGRFPLDEWSARRRDLYLVHTTLTTDRHLYPWRAFEPTIPATERPLRPTVRRIWNPYIYCMGKAKSFDMLLRAVHNYHRACRRFCGVFPVLVGLCGSVGLPANSKHSCLWQVITSCCL